MMPKGFASYMQFYGGELGCPVDWSGGIVLICGARVASTRNIDQDQMDKVGFIIGDVCKKSVVSEARSMLRAPKNS